MRCKSWNGISVWRILCSLPVAVTIVAGAFGQESVPESSLADRIALLEAQVASLQQGEAATSDGSPQTDGILQAAGYRQLQTPQRLFAPRKAYPVVRLTGFFQSDAGWMHQDTASLATVGDVQDGADFRRARLAAAGDVADNTGYLVEFDFAFPGRPSFMDVWLELRDTPWLNNLKIGQFRQPVGLDGLTSVRELTFIERGLPFAFLPFRQIGVMSSTADEERGITWALSGFRFPTTVFGNQAGDNGGYGAATRLTHVLAENADGDVIHIGSAWSFIDPSNDRIRYLSQPEFVIGAIVGGIPLAVPPFVDTGFLAARHTELFTLELASTYGPFHAQAEAIRTRVRQPGGSALTFSGVSAQAAWILTGEHRPYNHRSGVLGRVVPQCDFGDRGPGAWEAAVRWSLLDLNDGAVTGGRLNNATVGLNWYLNRFTKLQLNYLHAFLNRAPVGRSNADMVLVRAQVDF